MGLQPCLRVSGSTLLKRVKCAEEIFLVTESVLTYTFARSSCSSWRLNILFLPLIFLASSTTVHSQAPTARSTAVAFPKRPVKPGLVYSPQDPRFSLKHEICFNRHGSELNVLQCSLRETEFLWLTVSGFVTTTVGQRLGTASGIMKSNLKG